MNTETTPNTNLQATETALTTLLDMVAVTANVVADEAKREAKLEKARKQEEKQQQITERAAAVLAQDWAKGLTLDQSGYPVNNSANITKIVRNHEMIAPLLARDEFTGLDMFVSDTDGNTPMQKVHYTSILNFIQEHCMLPKATITDVMGAAEVVLNENRIDSLVQHLSSLPEWDGTNRIDTWLIDSANADDTPINRMFSRKFLIGMVERALKPGCTCKRTLIIQGEQNIGKSGIMKILVGNRGWFDDSIHDISSDNNAIHLKGKWLVEISENAAIGLKDRNLLKSYLSRETDNYRAPYDKQAKEHPRRSVFCITSNDESIINDPTGTSRYMLVQVHGFPIGCGKNRINFELLASIRDQLFAEAIHAVLEGETNSLSAEYEALADEQNQQIEHYDEWTEEVYAYLKYSEFVKVSDIIKSIDTNGSNRFQSENRVKSILTASGWKPSRDAAKVRGWSRKDEKSLPAYVALPGISKRSSSTLKSVQTRLRVVGESE